MTDWLDGLQDAKKDTLEHLKEAFTERFIQPSILRFKSAREIFGKKQEINETVDIYVNRLRTLGRRIGLEADDNTLLYALLSGLKPSLSGFVIGKNPQTFSEAIDAARIVELSVTDAPSSVAEQLADIKGEMQRLTKQYDASMTMTAAIEIYNRTPSRRVTFEDDAQFVQRAVSPERPRSPRVYERSRSYDQRRPIVRPFRRPVSQPDTGYLRLNRSRSAQGPMARFGGFGQLSRTPMRCHSGEVGTRQDRRRDRGAISADGRPIPI